MEAIARELEVSRSTVSRLLHDARTEGLVQITLRPPEAHRISDTAQEFSERFGVRTIVVPSGSIRGEAERLTAVAVSAARYLESLLRTDMTVGLAWGTTTSMMVEHLNPLPAQGIRVVQLNGAINSQGYGLTYIGTVLDRLGSLWEAQVHHFPVPAFFDHASTREALWQERSVQRILDLQSQVQLAVFGVGAFGADVPSHVYTTDYLSESDLHALHTDGAVGDVCTVMIRADGSWRGVHMNDRATGPDPDQLRHIPRRLLIAAGPRKALALRGALLAGVATDVVVDEATAQRVLRLEDQANEATRKHLRTESR